MIQRKVTTLGYVLFVAATLECVRGLPPTIRIGAIFTEEERGGSGEAAFKYAVHRINRDRALLPNTTLVFDVHYVPAHDTFHAAKKACKLISSGVTAVFGPSDALVGRHVQSMCSALDIPHVEARLDLQPERQGFSINLHPPHRVMVQAYGDVVRYLNWSRVAIVYEDDDGIIKLQDFIRRPPQRNMEIYVRQAEVKTYRDVLRQVRRKEFNNIIVDTRPENMHHFLRAILQLQMNDFNHHYFFTSFDMETFDLEDFKYNYVNMTAFRLVDGEHPLVRQILWDMEKFQPKGQHILNRTSIIEAEPALVYDSVYVFARGLQSLERSATLRLFNVTCEDEIPWNDGSSLFNYVNSVEFRGLTGKIQFKEGRRTNVKLDLVKLKQTSIAKVGEWSESTGVNVTDKAAFLDDTVPNITLVVTTIEEIPYVMVKKNGNLTGNARFEGFCIDLLRQLSIMIGFNYVIELVPDRKYGAPDKETGEWNGVVRQLLDKKADLAVAALTINYARESVIDFSKPFLNLGIGILIKVPKGQTTRLFSFLNPLAIEIWCYLLAAYLLVSFAMFVMARFSPYEWDDPHPCFTECDFVENQFSLSNSFWFITGTLLRQGSGLNPKVPSGHPTRLFSFMNPLAIEIWLYVLAAYVLVSTTMFIVARFSPYEWQNPHPCLMEPDFMENQFSLSNSFWFTIGTLMQQGSDLNPKAASTRIVGGIWWFFTLIIISSYTANLAAFLTVERMITPIENVDELAEQSEIAYGTLEGGSTMTFFRDSKMEMYQKMWRYMENKKPSVFVSSYDEGIQRVLEGNYAFLMETTTIDYFVQRNCNLTQVGGQLDSKGYGIATPRGSPWRDKISLAVLEMQEKNVVQVLYNKWWQSMGDTCSREEKSKESKANALGPDNIGGVFVVLLCGLAIAVFVAVLEFCWNSKKNAQTDRQSLCSEMAEELRFAVRCRGSRQRPALRRQCSRCMPGTTYVPANVDLPQENGMLQIMEMHKSPSPFDCADS